MRFGWLVLGMAAALAAGQARADLVVSNKATQNVNCANGVCTATAVNAVLNANDLATLLAAGDLKVQTGAGALNIVVKAPLSWTSASRLTFEAGLSVQIDKPVSVTGSGAMTITTNEDETTGDLMFDGQGDITFWDTGSSLVINGQNFTLVTDIATLATDVANDPSGAYALANDYDASVDGTYSSSPVTTELTGTFEGLGHAISNLTINSSDLWVGLFSEARGTLRDIGLRKVAITASGRIGIAGSLLSLSDVSNIIGCYSTGSITEESGVAGGLIGESKSSSEGLLTRSHSAVAVKASGSAIVGGLIGGSAFTISLSYATGTVTTGKNGSAGGLVGGGNGSWSQSYALGAVNAGANSVVGGFIGEASGDISNTYARGAVTSGKDSSVGGFVGKMLSAQVNTSYSTGLVQGGKFAGGFLGANVGGHFFADYFDTDTSGKTRHQGCGGGGCGGAIKGLTTEKFQVALPVGFDPNIWAEKQGINNGYPYLIAIPPE